MTDYAVNVLRSPVPAPAGATKPLRDQVLDGANGGVRFLFDLDFSWCYPGGPLPGRPSQGAPANDQVIYDIAERGNGRYRFNTVFEAPRATYSGGGFDFSPVSHRPFGVQGPTDAWASIHAGAQHFLWCGYFRLPSEADFKPSNGFSTLFMNSTATSIHISNPEPLQVVMIQPSTTKSIVFARQTAIGTITQPALNMNANFFNKLCQVAYWRNSAGVGYRVKSADGEVASAGVVGANNSANFSGVRPTWGNSIEGNLSLTGDDPNAYNYRVYRGWLEDLAISGRNPLTVLNADWDRVIARKLASGGTIFA